MANDIKGALLVFGIHTPGVEVWPSCGSEDQAVRPDHVTWGQDMTESFNIPALS